MQIKSRLFIQYFFKLGRFTDVAIGLVIFGVNCISIIVFEKELIQFFIQMYRQKSEKKIN